MDQLISNNVFELDLTIASHTNNKSYNQKLIINAVEFKGYVNILKINNETVEIKHKDGDTNINLVTIAGYSIIIQELQLTRMNDGIVCLILSYIIIALRMSHMCNTV